MLACHPRLIGEPQVAMRDLVLKRGGSYWGHHLSLTSTPTRLHVRAPQECAYSRSHICANTYANKMKRLEENMCNFLFKIIKRREGLQILLQNKKNRKENINRFQAVLVGGFSYPTDTHLES